MLICIFFFLKALALMELSFFDDLFTVSMIFKLSSIQE